MSQADEPANRGAIEADPINDAGPPTTPADALRVVGAAWLRDGRVLGARRGPGRRNAGLWELPGGKVEPGESDAAALRRELREELSVDVRVGALVGHHVHAYPHAKVHLLVYTCTSNGTARSCEHDALRWFAPDELDSVDWSVADIPIIEKIATGFQSVTDSFDPERI